MPNASKDYALQRFGFSVRKTRYLVNLAFKLEGLPQTAAALDRGEIGWVKAYRIASVATSQDEVMWLESALSLSVRELDERTRKAAEEADFFWQTFAAGEWDDDQGQCNRRCPACNLDSGAPGHEDRSRPSPAG